MGARRRVTKFCEEAGRAASGKGRDINNIVSSIR